MKSIKKNSLWIGLALAAVITTSCDTYNYTDDLQMLGKRVEKLEEMALKANTELTALNEIIAVIENNGYVTNVVRNADGTTTITFSTGREVTLRDGRQGVDGKDGEEYTMLISVAQDTDGKWYWTQNGEWILDGYGQKMPAGAVDGHDGKSAAENLAIVPLMRINPDPRNWEISTDGGNTWTDTGVCADGKDGKDGQDGQDDLFQQIITSEDGTTLTFVLSDGRKFIVRWLK